MDDTARGRAEIASSGIDRGSFLAAGATPPGTLAGWPDATAQTASAWNASPLVHLIRNANHERQPSVPHRRAEVKAR